MSMPRTPDAGRRQADYFRRVLQQELAETNQRVGHLSASLSDLIARDEAPIVAKRTRRALQAAVRNGCQVTAMLDALDRSYPPVASPTAVAS